MIIYLLIGIFVYLYICLLIYVFYLSTQLIVMPCHHWTCLTVSPNVVPDDIAASGKGDDPDSAAWP